MRILVVDKFGVALDWCMKCQDQGHEVRWHIRQDEKTKEIGRGLVQIVPAWQEWARWADLIVLADNTYYMDEVDAWKRKRGARVIGGTTESARLEMDRGEGMAAFKRAGIPVPPYREFTDYDKAIAYVKRENRRFVSKPRGDADKALSYCAKSPADMVFMLERWKKNGKIKGSFMLQEFISGVEMAVGGWYGPGGFNSGWCENFEFKKLLAGDLGVATGEQGTVLRYVRQSKLANKVLAPLEPMLEKLGYVGYVDVNCIIDEEGTPWPLEFTMRFGWPTFNIQQTLHEGDCAEWLADLSDGRDSLRWRQNKIACGTVLSIPDYPYSHYTRKEVTGIPLYGLKDSLRDRVSFAEMRQGEAPQDIAGKVVTAPCLVTAGDYVLIALGSGDTVQESRKAAYRVLKRLSMPNSPMWRVDIGARLAKQLPEIQKHGYATGMRF